MRFLVSVPDEVKSEEGAEPLEEGVPVIPSFPLGDCNVFIGSGNGGTCASATVVELPELDPDDFVKEISDTYPGIPYQMIEDMVVSVANVCMAIPDGPVFGVYVTEDSATMYLRGREEEKLIKLWADRPPINYL